MTKKPVSLGISLKDAGLEGNTVIHDKNPLASDSGETHRPSDKEIISQMKQLCSCLEDMATGKGGWDWESVLQEARETIGKIERC